MGGTRRPHRKKIAPVRLARIRLAVYERDGYACRSCGRQYEPPANYNGRYALAVSDVNSRGRMVGRVLELDHVHPYKHGGTSDLGNLQALCSLCNVRKGAKV